MATKKSEKSGGYVKVYDPVPTGSPMPWEHQDKPGWKRWASLARWLWRTRTAKLATTDIAIALAAVLAMMAPRFGWDISQEDAENIVVLALLLISVTGVGQWVQRGMALKRGNLPSKDLKPRSR